MTGTEKRGIEDLMAFGLEIIRRSGEVALSYYGKARAAVKFDERLVTEAELALREFFREEVERNYPEHQIFMNTQDTQNYTHRGNGALWVYNPLDGVANFQGGIPIWGSSLALLENFWPILGVFHMPATGDLFHALAGKEAFHGDSKIHVSSEEDIDDESMLLTYSRFHQQFRSSFPGKIRNMGCTNAHVCYVAMGRADAAILANVTYEDLAACRIIVESAGGKIYGMDGTEFFLNEYLDGRRISDPIVVTAPATQGLVREYIQGS
ncbi:MAG: inositol monophosphatase [Deltaproteobacteria bacterium]|nr:inositol monophosphatase [Deltaproteobacteria bacterium]MBW2137115.1 inositol monophosphatase [Deltaproteobacteria bacterium]